MTTEKDMWTEEGRKRQGLDPETAIDPKTGKPATNQTNQKGVKPDPRDNPNDKLGQLREDQDRPDVKKA
jgi:hypothetical protein